MAGFTKADPAALGTGQSCGTAVIQLCLPAPYRIEENLNLNILLFQAASLTTERLHLVGWVVGLFFKTFHKVLFCSAVLCKQVANHDFFHEMQLGFFQPAHREDVQHPEESN